jgi:hypothetical protein
MKKIITALLIFHLLFVASIAAQPQADSDNPKTGLYYYEWTGTRLKLVKFIAKSREEGR